MAQFNELDLHTYIFNQHTKFYLLSVVYHKVLYRLDECYKIKILIPMNILFWYNCGSMYLHFMHAEMYWLYGLQIPLNARKIITAV